MNDTEKTPTVEDLVREAEGTVLEVYLDTDFNPTCGTGHLVRPEDRLSLGQKITQAQADAFLEKDLAVARRAVKRLVKVELTPGQRAALEDFVFNEGQGRLEGSELLERVNRRDFAGAADLFSHYTKSGGKVQPGIVTRRQREAELLDPDRLVLQRGDKRPEVLELQAQLAQLGYFPRNPAMRSESFGPRTEVAVRAFQDTEGLVVDGKAGRETRARLRQLIAEKGGPR